MGLGALLNMRVPPPSQCRVCIAFPGAAAKPGRLKEGARSSFLRGSSFICGRGTPLPWRPDAGNGEGGPG